MKKINIQYMRTIVRLVSVVALLVVGVGEMWGTAATLPVDYTFSSGKSSLPTGVTASGLGGDYSDGTYKLKFDDDGDYLELETDGAVGRFIYTVKMLGGYYTSAFQLQGSTDGSSYSNIGGIMYISGSQNDVVNCTTSVAIPPTYRHFRFLFYKGSNVGFGKLKASKATTSKYTITFKPHGGSFADPSIFTSTSPDYTISEANAGEGIVLPAPNPPAGCASEGWGFYGWAESEVSSSTTTAPTIWKGGDRYYPTSATTLHAVYATGEYTKIASIGTGGLTSGSKYLIVAHYSDHDYIMKSTSEDVQDFSNNIKMVAAQIDAANGKYAAADVDADWCYTISEGSTNEWWIRDIVNNSSYNYADIGYGMWWGCSKDNSDYYAISVTDGIWNIRNNYGTDNYLGFDGSNLAFQRYGSSAKSLLLYKETTTPSYFSNPSCCDKVVEVSAGTKTHVSTIAFDITDVPTCGIGDDDRKVTITVTPLSGYTLNSTSRLEYSGDGTAAYVSGPTDNGNGTYNFVYQFEVDDDGSGSFAATAGRFTNYRTQCCDDPELAFLDENEDPTTEYTIVREDLASASTAVEIDCDFGSLNTSSAFTWYSTSRAAKTFPETGATSRTTPSSQLSYMTIDMSKKTITASQTGIYTITIKQAGATISERVYCDAEAAVTVTVKTVDKFVDAVNGNFSGEPQRLEDVGGGILLPTEATFTENNVCHSTTRRLLGWIKASDLETYRTAGNTGYIDSWKTGDASNKVIAPGTRVAATGVTWYAVWGEEVTP